MATRLDGVSIDVDEVAREIVEFAFAELHVDHAVVRQRVPDGRYKLIAKCTRMQHADIGDLLQIDEVPVLGQMVDEARPAREPVLQDRVDAREAGKYAPVLVGMRLLGVDAVLGSRPVGFIALLRSSDKERFFISP